MFEPPFQEAAGDLRKYLEISMRRQPQQEIPSRVTSSRDYVHVRLPQTAQNMTSDAVVKCTELQASWTLNSSRQLGVPGTQGRIPTAASQPGGGSSSPHSQLSA